MKRGLVVAGVAAVMIVGGIQLIRPERTNPPENPAAALAASFPVPGNVQAILERSCMDCHSNRTRWPWYSSVAPASWLVAKDVNEGREHLNFSEWGTYRRARMITALNIMVSVLDKGEMPPSQYLLLHAEATLTDADIDTLCAWAEAASDSLSVLGTEP